MFGSFFPDNFPEVIAPPPASSLYHHVSSGPATGIAHKGNLHSGPVPGNTALGVWIVLLY